MTDGLRNACLKQTPHPPPAISGCARVVLSNGYALHAVHFDKPSLGRRTAADFASAELPGIQRTGPAVLHDAHKSADKGALASEE